MGNSNRQSGAAKLKCGLKLKFFTFLAIVWQSSGYQIKLPAFNLDTAAH